MLLATLIASLLFCLCKVATSSTAFTPVVQTKTGALLGEIVGQENQYYAYRGIPYAAAPVGEFRFEPPVAHRGWPGVLQATYTMPHCPQWQPADAGSTNAHQSEDCLHLNVFVPQVNTSTPLPVLVFIHGGGLMWGSADYYGEEFIMARRNLILVTLNYRLGPFGFLSTEDAQIAGNMGLKDQAVALQWVHENIERFGGDSERVVLTGWSAGGASVHFHMLSEWTQSKWFHSAVSFSGTALCPCHAIYPKAAYNKARQLAEYLNCDAVALNTTEGIKNCLKKQTTDDIVAQIPKFYKYSNHPFAIFGPVIENNPNDRGFLTDHVACLMKAGKTKSKPWLISLTAEDGAFGTAEFLKKDSNGRELIYDLEERWLELAPILLFFNSSWTLEEQHKQALYLKTKYFGTRPISLDTYKELEQLYNAELGIKHVKQTVQLYVNYTTNAKAFGYVYDNPAPYGFGQILAERDDWKFGTLHGDDIALIFNIPTRKNHPFREDEKKISQNFIEMLEHLATNGTPKYNGRELTMLTADQAFRFTQITKNS